VIVYSLRKGGEGESYGPREKRDHAFLVYSPVEEVVFRRRQQEMEDRQNEEGSVLGS